MLSFVYVPDLLWAGFALMVRGNFWVNFTGAFDTVVVMHPISGLWRGIRRDDSLEVSSESRDQFSILDLSCFLWVLPELYYQFDLDVSVVFICRCFFYTWVGLCIPVMRILYILYSIVAEGPCRSSLYICFWLDSVMLYELSFLHLSRSSLFYFVWNIYMLLLYIFAWVMYHILTSQSSCPGLQSYRCSQSVGIPGCYKDLVKTLLHQQRLHPFLSYTKVSFVIEFLDLELARRNVNLRHLTFSPTLCSDTNCSQNSSICNTC